MGRGEAETLTASAALRSEPRADQQTAIGQKWARRDDPERTLEILHVTPEWSHVSVLIRISGEQNARLYSSEKLSAEWAPVKGSAPDSAPQFSLLRPPPRDDVPECVMLGGKRAWEAILAREAAASGKPAEEIEEMTPRQSGYLKSLCEKHGREFDPALSKKKASALISELKALPDPEPKPAAEAKRPAAPRAVQPELA